MGRCEFADGRHLIVYKVYLAVCKKYGADLVKDIQRRRLYEETADITGYSQQRVATIVRKMILEDPDLRFVNIDMYKIPPLK